MVSANVNKFYFFFKCKKIKQINFQFHLGRTKGPNSVDLETFAKTETDFIIDFYKSEMTKIFHVIFPEKQIADICSNKPFIRFIWILKYIC